MAKRAFMRIVLVISSILIIIGILLMVQDMTSSDEVDEIEVRVNNNMAETLEFKDLALIPGESCEYTIKLKGAATRQYILSLDFVEKGDQSLKDFAYVKMISGDEVIYDKLLADAFEDDDIAFDVDFSEYRNTELTIVYYLPMDVGNEAKNAEAIFNLEISAKYE